MIEDDVPTSLPPNVTEEDLEVGPPDDPGKPIVRKPVIDVEEES